MTFGSGFVERIAGQSRPLLIAEAAFLTVILGAADVWTGSEFSFSIFYLLPISLTALTLGKRWALANAGIASLIWLAADYAAGHVYSSPIIPYWNATVRLGYFVLFAVLFARLRSALEEESGLARLDPLTGIFNRRAFEELAASEISRAERYGRPLSLAFVDLDHFKQVNDDFGHEVGDTVLRQVAATLVATMRSADTVARLGGDEFAVLMPETDSPAAMIALEKSRAALKARMLMNGWPTTFSVGVVSADSSQLTLPELMAAADLLMYEAKRTGRDRIVQTTDPGVEVVVDLRVDLAVRTDGSGGGAG